MASVTENPLFPVALGGLAAAGYYFYSKAKCECHAREEKKKRRQLESSNRKHPADSPIAELKDVMLNDKVRPENVRLVKIVRSIRGTTKFIYSLPTGQLFFSYGPIHNV
jgi:hypothetical protein